MSRACSDITHSNVYGYYPDYIKYVLYFGTMLDHNGMFKEKSGNCCKTRWEPDSVCLILVSDTWTMNNRGFGFVIVCMHVCLCVQITHWTTAVTLWPKGWQCFTQILVWELLSGRARSVYCGLVCRCHLLQHAYGYKNFSPSVSISRVLWQ